MASIMVPRESASFSLPKLPPGGVAGFIPHLTKHEESPVSELLQPYKDFESELRKIYAQQPDHDAVKNGCVNLVPIFDGHQEGVKIRGRKLSKETEEEKEKFIMSLKNEERLADGAPAIVSSFRDFQQNFNLFSESSLADLDWSNVVAAGSAVTTALLPVPEKWAGSKRSLREYYHQHLAPASDVDLFIYGLNEEEAIEKIKKIERNIKDSILHETTTIRTKNAITIASQYPTRHVQIVLRLYDSISQIITGFDVDCACVAYTGKQVFAAPRAIAAFITQCNTIDLTRRSPSYENRLSKYSHRGFEAYWPLLDRTRIDPTIFERSFGRTQGLARLLILEKLPKAADRESYMDQRRAERGRPAVQRGYRYSHGTKGNIKEQEEDEVAEWVEQEEASSYHTMTVPYGEKYTAAKITRLLYAKDLLLNAEWNQDKEREVYLHRHPCFFGNAEEVIQDCCGYCPEPKTDEEIEIAEEESKTNVSGTLKFLKDDPGRQEIGSFNPITDDEWTTMAYVGDTARLCQAIVDGDVEHVEDWCTQEGVDINRRDYTGRTPLHLAVMVSTIDVVQCLINHGARLIARLIDGRTALHLAAARGNINMVKALMDKSLANEEAENEKKDAKRAAKMATSAIEHESRSSVKHSEVDSDEDSASEASSISLESQDIADSDSMTMGSFVKIDSKEKEKADDGVLEDSPDDPDFYDVNVIAWDYGLSPLHLALLNGHLNVIETLASEYGADVLLPVKLVEPGTSNARGAIMTLVLALSLPIEKSKETIQLLLKLGATSAQADMNHFTAFHYIVGDNNQGILNLLLEHDRPAALSILNNLGFTRNWDNEMNSPLTTAVGKGFKDMTKKLLELGARPAISFDDWIKGYLAKNDRAKNHTAEQNLNAFHTTATQPIITAAIKESGQIVQDLLAYGADPNTLEKTAWSQLQNKNYRYYKGETILDIVQKKIKTLSAYVPEADHPVHPIKPEKLRSETSYIFGLADGTYQKWTAINDFKTAKQANKKAWEIYQTAIKEEKHDGVKEKTEFVTSLIHELKQAEKSLLAAGAKTFKELHPDIQAGDNDASNYAYKTPVVPDYQTKFSFNVPDLNDTKKDGYLRLFEAAWTGDVEEIKSLTLAPWQPKTGGSAVSPLRVAVQDGNSHSPFSIAVLRGHYDLAEKIVEICLAQYHDNNTAHKKRWNMKSDTDDEDCSDYESEDDHGLPISSELISDKYTVDNLGEVASVVKSDVMPLAMIAWSCATQYFLLSEEVKHEYSRSTILEHAVVTDDMKLLKFMIQLGQEQQIRLAREDDAQRCYTIQRDVFLRAIKLGRTHMLAEMIRSTGVGIPLNQLIKSSGIELKMKPRYYQGLTVGGKKRADWAQAPGGEIQIVEERIPPLLQAAHVGSIESVEWFMSDAPMRRYKEFAEANKNDKRVRTLAETGKGFEKTIGTWLDAKNDLTLHCAILHTPVGDSQLAHHLGLIRHLLAVMPNALEKKSSEGWTPLQLAVWTQREDVISHLLSIGANQRHRDKLGRNLMHVMLERRYGKAELVETKFRALIGLFEKNDVTEMLTERCTISPGALSPLAYWMSHSSGSRIDLDIMKILAEYSNGEDLEMINGEGDLPLHVAVKKGLSTISGYLLSLNPSLLHRENATGRTPLEMARDIYLASCVQEPPNVKPDIYYYPNQDDYNATTRRPAAEFVPKRDEGQHEETKKRTYEVCMQADRTLLNEECDGEPKHKRRLVSLFEANEVARRLAGRKTRGRGHGVANGYLIDDAGKSDVVSEWMEAW
ncbi:hypothetical protein B0O99DRAFT_606743 [Bisporella sp. PMI_857]|nr:hypothetical protein B0O99DRAFT_606743 [Bisporella sp. PMI_857]